MSEFLATAHLLATPSDLLPTHPSALSEGPIWHSDLNCFFLILIDRGRVLQLSEQGKLLRSFRIGCMIGSLGITSDPNQLLVAVQKGWAFLNLEDGSVRFADEIESSINTASNDGKVGPDGAFYFGTKDLSFKDPIAAFYRLDTKGEITRLISGLTISNGVDWSPDGKSLYHVDSINPEVSRYRFDTARGVISDRSILCTSCDGKRLPAAAPDGLCVDSIGNIFIAEWGLGRIGVWSPNGLLLGYIETPFTRPTSCAFGGRDLATLLITSEAHPGDEREAGGLAVVRLEEFRGRRATCFRGV